MAIIPEHQTTEKDLAEWYRLSAELKQLRAKEILLRKKIFGAYFPNPKEGVNKYDLEDNYVLKATHKLSRDIDEGALDAITPQLFNEYGIRTEDLVKRKPELKLKEYRKLSEEQALIFDQALIIKPTTPSLEIVKPKR